jgi:hypothetical protein
MFVLIVPPLVFSNLFAMFFLEILSSTKQVTGKKEADLKLGNAVNLLITGIFLLYFGLMLVSTAFTQSEMATPIRFFNSWFSISNPFDAALTGQTLSIISIG